MFMGINGVGCDVIAHPLWVTMAIGVDFWVAVFAVGKGVVSGYRAITIDSNDLTQLIEFILRRFTVVKAVSRGYQQSSIIDKL